MPGNYYSQSASSYQSLSSYNGTIDIVEEYTKPPSKHKCLGLPSWFSFPKTPKTEPYFTHDINVKKYYNYVSTMIILRPPKDRTFQSIIKIRFGDQLERVQNKKTKKKIDNVYFLYHSKSFDLSKNLNKNIPLSRGEFFLYSAAYPVPYDLVQPNFKNTSIKIQRWKESCKEIPFQIEIFNEFTHPDFNKTMKKTESKK